MLVFSFALKLHCIAALIGSVHFSPISVYFRTMILVDESKSLPNSIE
jgi:hypothetical protein